MGVPSHLPFDWTIDNYGLRLAPKEITGQRPHDITPIPFLSQQISSTAELTYTDINRDVEIAFAQDDFTGGASDNLRFNVERQRRFRYSKHADTSVPGYVLPGPKVETVGSAIVSKPSLAVQRGSITYLAAGANLYQVATSTSTPALDTTFAADITALYVWGGNLIVGLGSSTNFRYRTGDTSASAFTDGGAAAHFIASINDQLYRAVRPNKIDIAQSAAGPWAEFDVGDSSYTITSIGALDNLIIVGKEDAPYAFDSDNVAVPLAPELRLQADAQVCRATAAFNRDYYFSSRRGLVRLRPGEGLKNTGLDLLADPALPSNESRPTALATDGRFLYHLVVSGSGVYIWKLDGKEAWHNYLYRTDLGASADLLYVTNKIGATSVNAVLFAYASGGNWQLAYARWPATADPTRDADYRFETAISPVVRTLDYTASYPTIQKYSDRLKSVTDNAGTTRKVAYAAYLDDEATSKSLGEFQKSPHEEKVLGDPLEFHRASMEMTLTSEAASAPKLRAFHLSTALLPRVVRKHTCQFLAASATPLTSGGRGRGDWSDVVERLRTLRETSAAVDCRDEDGRKFKAYLSEVVEWTAQERQAADSSPVKVITTIFKEVVIS